MIKWRQIRVSESVWSHQQNWFIFIPFLETKKSRFAVFGRIFRPWKWKKRKKTSDKIEKTAVGEYRRVISFFSLAWYLLPFVDYRNFSIYDHRALFRRILIGSLHTFLFDSWLKYWWMRVKEELYIFLCFQSLMHDHLSRRVKIPASYGSNVSFGSAITLRFISNNVSCSRDADAMIPVWWCLNVETPILPVVEHKVKTLD